MLKRESPIRVLIDGRYLIDPKTGVAKYLKSLIKGLLASNDILKIGIVLGKGDKETDTEFFLDCEDSFDRGKLYFHSKKFSRNLVAHAFFSHLIINRSDADIYLHPHYDSPFFIKKRFLFVLHDFNPLVQSRYFSRFNFIKKNIFRLFIIKSMNNKSSVCVCISKNTFEDLMRYIGNHSSTKTSVIYSGADVKSPGFVATNIPESFILYVGDRRRHKNLKRMVDIYLTLRAQNLYSGDFVIAGDERNDGFDLETYVSGNPVVKVLGRVSEGRLSELYSNCDSLFYLSTYEGFGMPIVEASAFNKKIITSNTSSLKDIAPDHALLLNLELADDLIINTISEYLSETLVIDNGEYMERFDWAQVAGKYISTIQKFI